MGFVAPVIFLFACWIIQNNATESTTYTTKYDGIDLDEILANERLLTGYVKCLLEEGPCTPDGKELKKNLPDAIEHDCEKCTDRQRDGADQVMHYIIDHRPEDWNKLEQKYDDSGSYKRNYLSKKQSEMHTSNTTENSGDKSKKSSDEEET